jgi:hypothetical protein
MKKNLGTIQNSGRLSLANVKVSGTKSRTLPTKSPKKEPASTFEQPSPTYIMLGANFQTSNSPLFLYLPGLDKKQKIGGSFSLGLRDGLYPTPTRDVALPTVRLVRLTYFAYLDIDIHFTITIYKSIELYI